MFTPDQLRGLKDAAAAVVHAFVWKKRPRGRVQYWLPDGKEDVPGNRLYGQAAQRAARRAEGTTPAPAPPSPTASPTPASAAPQWTDEDRRDFEMRPADPAVAAAVPDFNILDIIDAEPLSSPEPDAATSATADPEGTTTWGTPELAADWSRHAGAVTPHQVVGAPPGSRVVVRTSPDGDFLVDVSHPAIAECRRLVHAKGGKRYVKNLTFVAKGEHQNSGLGADVFARQVAELSAAGFSHIECYAAGPPYNGYATWPRFGYDQAIDTLESSQQAKVRRKFPDAKSVLDILATPEGRDWWMGKKGPDGKRTGGNGFSLPRAVFDLRPGSRSMRVMAAYLAEKAAAKKSPSPPSKKPPSIGPGKSSAAGSPSSRAWRSRHMLGYSEVYAYAGWGDWKQIEGGKWRSPGGRVLSDAAYQKLSKGKAGTPAPTTPKPEEPPKPEEKPGLIRRTWNATYGAAKERYGPRTAGAMAAAVALPIPGSILAVPALAAIGEIDRALTGGPKKPSPTQPNPVPPKKPDPALGIARAKAEVARAAADAARKPGSGVEPDRVAWLEARARKAEDDLKRLGG